MDNARDEPLIVQLWLDLEKRFGWDRVRVVYAPSTVTVSLDVTLCEKIKCERFSLNTLQSQGLYFFFFSYAIFGFPK